MTSFKHLAPTQTLIDDVRRKKYLMPDETDWSAGHRRVAEAIFDDDTSRMAELIRYLGMGAACPAGRVLAGAGTGKNVTLWNCFVAPLVQDSMRTNPDKPGVGIMDALASVAYSMQMGGGVGTDFSTLRPEAALVRRVQASASGPLPFMDMWDSMCRTIMSAGERRGAMMATLLCDHPDIRKFIQAKRTDPRRLRMFNLSVLVTDKLMRAVEQDTMFALGHWEPPARKSESELVYEHRSDPFDGHAQKKWYIYELVRARELWGELMRSTYETAEPGVIFIDRVNYWNNLGYCEHIQCTNPCGEQPLPPDQNCNLAHVNLARCTIEPPFSVDSHFDLGLIGRVTALLVRMSDRIIDLSLVPNEAQLVEAQLKRRIGLGVTGLANGLMFVRARYGSSEAISHTRGVMSTLRNSAYRESIELARELGPFPAFDREAYLNRPFIRKLPEDIRDGIAEHGIRNALLLTVAPTGTVSIAQAENASGGIEPVFEPRYARNKLEGDGSYSKHFIEDLGFRVYANEKFNGDLDAALAEPLPDYMVSVPDLTADDHLVMQATVQEYVDSSISKTINLPTETPFNEFEGIYLRAYEMGCKGCTTYRPNPDSGRGEVLSSLKPTTPAMKPVPVPVSTVIDDEMHVRPRRLPGETYQVHWAALSAALYVTINDEELPDGKRMPREIFINSKAVEHAHWQAALTRMISAVMRKGGDLSFIPQELKQIHSALGGEWINKRFVPSEVALIGYVIEEHFRAIGYLPPADKIEKIERREDEPLVKRTPGRECRSCGEFAVIRQEGCDKCTECGWSNCG